MKILFVITIAFLSAVVNAEPDSYCLQKSFSEYGNTETCFKNISLSAEQFKLVCQPPGDEEFRFEAKFITSCPANYKGVCKGLKMQNGKPLPYESYLYKNDIPFMKKSCISNGGQWVEGDA